MSQDVELLERIAHLRNNLKSLQHNTPQYVRLAQMESSLWDEHKELLERQAALEQSLKQPAGPINRGQSMMVEIRRPPVGDIPLSVIQDEAPRQQQKPMLSPRSKTARRSQEGGARARPPAKGWECVNCGYVNNGDKYDCESCVAPYTAPNTMQGNTMYNKDQTAAVDGRPVMKPSGSQQQAKIVKDCESQPPGGAPSKTPFAKSTSWTCHQCTFSNQSNLDECGMCGTKVSDVASPPPLILSPTSPSSSSQGMTPPTSTKTPVQRQQTEDDKTRSMSAHEYMQREEEEVRDERSKVKI